MIIDAHTHIYPDSVARKALSTVLSGIKGKLKPHTRGTLASLLESMDDAGIDLSVILPIATSPGHTAGILEWIKKTAPVSPRTIFFGTAHPYDPNFREQIREMADLGLPGLKFHPAYQQFPVDCREAYAVYEEAQKYGLAMYFHSGIDPSVPGCDYTSVERFAAFVRDFSGAKIVLAHGGGYREWGKVLDLLNGRRCFFDVAFVLEHMKRDGAARELFRQNEDYFIFGSDSPWRSQKKYVESICGSSTLTEIQKEKLLFRNVQKIIPGIARGQAAAAG